MATEQTSGGPFAEGAGCWRAAGWDGTLPLPPQTKWPPPTGFTGHDGTWPTDEQVATWASTQPTANLAVRVPDGVIGLDIDAYKDAGRASLADLEARCGPLPPTWRTSARTDPASGIRWYQVPAGTRLRGAPAPGIEAIQWWHRYAVVWPSLHPIDARPYLIYTPSGETTVYPPPRHALPTLPSAWLEALHEPVRAAGEARPLTHTGEWSPAVTRAVADAAVGLQREGGRHDTALAAAGALARLERLGHPGASPAIDELAGMFTRAIADRAGDREAEAEWRRIIDGARQLVAASSSQRPNWEPAPERVDPADLIHPDAHAAANSDQIATPAGDEEPHPSWQRADVAAVLAGTHTVPEPTILPRADGLHLIYPGRVNGLYGETEAAKSWLALCAAAAVLLGGGNVLYLDLEMGVTEVVDRLRALGVPDTLIAQGLDYRQPDDPVATWDRNGQLHWHTGNLAAWQAAYQDVDLVIVDTSAAWYELHGLDGMSELDAQRMARYLLEPMAKAGAAVLWVDHVTKDKETRGRWATGSQRKLSALTGVGYMVDTLEPFGRGLVGRFRLTVGKDRPGYVRARSTRTGTADITAIATLTSDPIDGRVTWSLNRAEKQEKDTGGIDAKMLKAVYDMIIYYVGTHGKLPSGNAIETSVRGSAQAIREHLRRLVDDGHVAKREGPRGAFVYEPVKALEEDDEP